MKSMIGRWALAAVLAAGGAAGAAAEGGSGGAARPVVEVVFVLDTTGSMGGLIEGAKRKIWSVVNELAKAKPAPDLRLGLVAYRDRGDEYLTKVVPLTSNLDAAYARLLSLKADGGGDEPEDVKSGLRDAVEKAGWSSGKGAARIVFLVGDAPPHLEYADTPPLEAILQAAVRRGLRVNAIRCGGNPRTGEVWERIARLGEGRFMTIEADGGVASVETPYDRELAGLNVRLEETSLGYGGGARAEAERRSMVAGLAASAPAPAMADRAAYEAKAGFSAEADLISAVDGGRVRLEDVPERDLPESLRKKSLPELRRALDEARARRRTVESRIAELTKRREAWLAGRAAAGAPRDAFDEKVVEALKAELADAGLAY